LNDNEKLQAISTTQNNVLLKEKLMLKCISIAESINNYFPMITKTCQVLINKARDVAIDTGLLLEYLAFRECFNNLINRRDNLREK
jgi:hypothetical protein